MMFVMPASTKRASRKGLVELDSRYVRAGMTAVIKNASYEFRAVKLAMKYLSEINAPFGHGNISGTIILVGA
jgi:hypothetical protein